MARLNNTAVKVQVWDTAGQQRFRSITQAYYRGAAGFVCMFDVTERSSFDNIRDIWLKETPGSCLLGKPIVIIGIRHDQTTSRHRAVEATEGHAMARDLKVSGNVEGRVRYAEANPVTGEGISRAMACLVEQILLTQELDGPSLDSPSRAVPTKQSRMKSIAASLLSAKRRFSMERDESLSELFMTHVAMLHDKAVQTLS
jgi:GTPase SAR1 family protein